MSDPIFASERMFEVWRYTVSHSQLLLRSTKTDTNPTRIDILFKAVSLMAIKPSLNGLTIARWAEAEWPDAWKEAAAGNQLYLLNSEGFTGYVAAGAFVTSEDELDYYEPSPLWVETNI